MTDPSRRNVQLYPWYEFLFGSFFWVPIFFLFFIKNLDLEQVLLLESIYFFSVVSLEIPSGYFSDALGRRPTLLIASGCLAGSYTLFLLADSFYLFASAEFLLAAGIAFHSGTNTSFLYDSLVDLNRQDEYGEIEAAVGFRVFLAGALGAVLGGLVALSDSRLAYGLSLVTTLPMIGIAWIYCEPRSTRRRKPDPGDMRRQIARCLGLIRQPVLRWLLAFGVVMILLNHVPWEFFQPYLHLLGADFEFSADKTPLVSGVYTAMTMILAAMFAKYSMRIRNRVGLLPVLFFALLLQTLLISLMGFLLSATIAMAVLFRSVPRAIMTAPINAAMAPRIPTEARATWFSIQSMLGRFAFAAWLSILSSQTGGGETASWTELSSLLQKSSLVAVIGGTLLLLSIPRELRSRSSPSQKTSSGPELSTRE
ncbi:MAG: MFS transporter [Planctomycetota bacterium]|jgi:MFS family permease|nr:MFS transporter [Planctomycetota bacterium]